MAMGIRWWGDGAPQPPGTTGCRHEIERSSRGWLRVFVGPRSLVVPPILCCEALIANVHPLSLPRPRTIHLVGVDVGKQLRPGIGVGDAGQYAATPSRHGG